MDRLTPNQRLFVEHLLADEMFNPTRAARAAGYKNPGVAGYKNLKNAAVAALIGKSLQRRITEVGLNAKDVLEHLATVLYLDPIHLFTSMGDGIFCVKNLEDIPAHIRRCITKFKCRTKTTETGSESYIEVELMSKDQALPLVMKHLGIIGTDGAAVNVNLGTDLITALLAQVERERQVIDTKFIEQQT
jgi:hypothetical protein